MGFLENVLSGVSKVASDHLCANFFDRDLAFPAEFYFRFGWIAKKGFDFCAAEVAWVNLILKFPIQTYKFERRTQEVIDATVTPGC